MRPSICFDPLGEWILPFPETGTRGSHHCGPMELSHWDRCIKPGRRLHPAPEAMTHPTRAVTGAKGVAAGSPKTQPAGPRLGGGE